VTRWFRFYDETLNDPKILRLSDNLFRIWVGLLCVASKHDGHIPTIDDLTFALRITPVKIDAALSKLIELGLIDNDEGDLIPHNWSGRQYKSDTSNERVKRHRQRKCNVTVTPPEQNTETEQIQIDKIGERASVFTEGSKKLATAFWKAMGFATPLQVPPEFAGVDWRAIGWEVAGWTDDLITAEVRRIGPDKPLSYYEKVFATSFAKRQAPLPIVEIREADKLTVTHGTAKNQSGGSILAAIDRELAKVQREENTDPATPAYPVLCISNGPIQRS
jgi:hypothetical protein